jgi:hypothetical protein
VPALLLNGKVSSATLRLISPTPRQRFSREIAPALRAHE